MLRRCDSILSPRAASSTPVLYTALQQVPSAHLRWQRVRPASSGFRPLHIAPCHLPLRIPLLSPPCLPGQLPFLTAWQDGVPQPGVSTINSFAGRVIANSVVIPASADGSINIYSFDTTDFLVDINGYYAPDNGTTGLYYYPITQCRASDTSISGGPYAADTARTVSIPAASGCSHVPSDSKAYAITVTALPNGNALPFITAYPSGQPRPNASILNAFQGQTVSASAIIPRRGADHRNEVYAFTRTDVVVDVSGYFASLTPSKGRGQRNGIGTAKEPGVITPQRQGGRQGKWINVSSLQEAHANPEASEEDVAKQREKGRMPSRVLLYLIARPLDALDPDPSVRPPPDRLAERFVSVRADNDLKRIPRRRDPPTISRG